MRVRIPGLEEHGPIRVVAAPRIAGGGRTVQRRRAPVGAHGTILRLGGGGQWSHLGAIGV